MCQAYEGERNFIVSMEQWAAKAGYLAHKQGLPKSANPHSRYSKYEREAWDHGWGCRQIGIIPYGIETDIRRKPDGHQDYGLKVTTAMADAFVSKEPAVQAAGVYGGAPNPPIPPEVPDDPRFVEHDA